MEDTNMSSSWSREVADDEIEVLTALACGAKLRPALSMVLRLRGPGLIEVVNGTCRVTLAGRARLDEAIRRCPAAPAPRINAF